MLDNWESWLFGEGIDDWEKLLDERGWEHERVFKLGLLAVAGLAAPRDFPLPLILSKSQKRISLSL